VTFAAPSCTTSATCAARQPRSKKSADPLGLRRGKHPPQS
jgi:hypothetical protein